MVGGEDIVVPQARHLWDYQRSDNLFLGWAHNPRPRTVVPNRVAWPQAEVVDWLLPVVRRVPFQRGAGGAARDEAHDSAET